MGSFLSDSAKKSAGNGKRPYTIAEDTIICQGLEDGDSASVIVGSLAEEGYERTVLSVRYRVSKLREVAEKYETLEEFHKVTK